MQLNTGSVERVTDLSNLSYKSRLDSYIILLFTLAILLTLIFNHCKYQKQYLCRRQNPNNTIWISPITILI